MPPQPAVWREPGKSSDAECTSRWDNLRVAALCIGVKAYPGSDALDTTVKDTKAMHKKINLLDQCRAAMILDPESRVEMYEKMRKRFLELLSSIPPELVIIFYEGHGKEFDGDLFLMPTGAQYDDPDDCKQTCISHREVLE